MDVDEIFKRPALPKASLLKKRAAPPPNVSSTSLDDERPAKQARVSIQEGTLSDEEDDVAPDDGEFAPGNDADYFVDEDEEEGGRFFGGGLNETQKQVLNIMDQAGDDLPVEDLTPASAKRTLLNLEKAINKNRELRTRFPDDPEKFVDSEFDLISTISSLLLFTTKPVDTYPLAVQLGTVTSMADLLSHENTDVSSAVVQVLEEWTDEEVLQVDPDEFDNDLQAVDDETDERIRVMKELTAEIEKNDLVALVISGLSRLNEQEEGDRNAVYYSLGFIENLTSLLPSILMPQLTLSKPLVPFLFARFENTKLEWQNRYYASEILDILLALPLPEIDALKDELSTTGDWIERLLKVISTYRKRDPDSSEESEFLSTLFGSLNSLLLSPIARQAFEENEGTELLVLMLKEKKQARLHSLTALQRALEGNAGRGNAVRFIDSGGLGSLFSIFMGKGDKATHAVSVVASAVSVLASLFNAIDSSSPLRVRLLSKFIEKDYEKVGRLFEARDMFEKKIAREQELEDAVEAERDDDDDEDEKDDDAKYLSWLDMGGEALQRADLVVAWICMEDDGIKDHVKTLLSKRSISFQNVAKTLDEWNANIEAPAPAPLQSNGNEGQDGLELSEAEEMKLILDNLAQYLKALQ